MPLGIKTGPTLGVTSWNQRNKDIELICGDSWLLAREDAPECIQCNELLTIKHILLHCIDFQPIREKHYNADSMYNFFDTVSIDSIISFIKEIGLYKKL